MIDMQTPDTTLTCSGCGQEFTFTAREQLAYARKGQSKPSLCAFCRAAGMIAHPDRSPAANGSERSEHQMYPATCSDCGQRIMVPFEPRGTRPVYCSRCYENHGGGRGGRSRSGSYSRR